MVADLSSCNSRIARVLHDGSARDRCGSRTRGRRPYIQSADHVISTMPVRQLIQRLDPPAPGDVVGAARRLKYRDFLTVALIVDAPALFPGQLDLRARRAACSVGRIQNFKNWSPDMVPDQR